MSKINTTSIAYMEQFVERCLKASPSWYMSDICHEEKCNSLYNYGTSATNSLSPSICGELNMNTVYDTHSVSYSGSHDKSFASGIRRSGCRVPF